VDGSQYTVAGALVTMPVRVRKADVHTAMFSVPADAAQRLIDYSGLQVCRFRPGRAVVTLMFARYFDGDLGRGIDQFHVAPQMALQHRRDQRIVRAPQDERVDFIRQKRNKIFLHDLKRHRLFQPAFFHERHDQRTGLPKHLSGGA